MAYDDLFQPAIYKSWNEAIIKEKKIRAKWQEEYGSKINKDLLQKDEISYTCSGDSIYGTRVESQMCWPREGATGTSTIIRVYNNSPDMVVPNPTVKSILYEGISKDGKGRIGYLKRRYQKDPEERYRRIVCTSWKCGWNHGKENELSCKDVENCNIRKKAFDTEFI